MHNLNPAFNQWATAPDGPHYLLLPIDKADHFSKKIVNIPEKTFALATLSGEIWGYLSQIAAQFHTTTQVIKTINRKSSDRLREGEHLLINVAAKEVSHYSLSQDERTKKASKAI